MGSVDLQGDAQWARAVRKMKVRRALVDARHSTRKLTARWRALPNLLVIGAQRGGTSSLYKYLGQHPAAHGSLRKETQYFSTRYSCGESWYRANFQHDIGAGERGGSAAVTFEATPDYLLHPLAAERASSIVPGTKVIALLRDPVERAYSHYQHMARLRFEELGFSEALAAEEARLSGEIERVIADASYPAKNLLRYSYFTRGKYVEGLEKWMRHYPLGDRMLVLKSEDFFSDTAASLIQIERFLDIDEWVPDQLPNYSYAGGKSSRSDQPMAAQVRSNLENRFKPWNEKLNALLGSDLGW